MIMHPVPKNPALLLPRDGNAEHTSEMAQPSINAQHPPYKVAHSSENPSRKHIHVVVSRK